MQNSIRQVMRFSLSQHYYMSEKGVPEPRPGQREGQPSFSLGCLSFIKLGTIVRKVNKQQMVRNGSQIQSQLAHILRSSSVDVQRSLRRRETF